MAVLTIYRGQPFMMLPFRFRRITLILTLIATPFLVGSSCAFFFSSGGGSSDKKEEIRDGEENIVVVSSGNFGDPPIAGVSYESGSLSGVTGEKGEFQYENDKTVRFFIGDINLGPAVIAKPVMTPKDLVLKDLTDPSAGVNIQRLLQSLDSAPGDKVITIPEDVRVAAVRSNDTVSAAIEFLDFSDNGAFVNTASLLVAALTNDYPFTAMLVDADNLHEQPVRRLEAGK
jgi:hypothetical protein